MTLDEAIKHAEEVADKKKQEKQKWDKWLESDYDHRAVAEKVSCELCADEHRQLAEWLKDYKQLLEQEPILDKIRAEIEQTANEEQKHDEKWAIGLRYAVKIIDKYKAESEDSIYKKMEEIDLGEIGLTAEMIGVEKDSE